MQSENQPRSESILVVDDDVRVVELLQITLTGRGYQVLTAYDGRTALEAVQRGKPDLLVLDSRLPVKSGFEVLDAIRHDANFPNLPVILISADAATESRLQGLRLGADDYLVKPFSPRELIIKIRRILDRAMDHNLLLRKTGVLEDEVRKSRDCLLEMRQEMGQSLNRMSTMLHQVIELGRVRPIDAILDRFVMTTVANLDFGRVVLLVNGEDGRYFPRVWRGVEPAIAQGLVFSPQSGLAQLCATLRRPVRADECADLPDSREDILRLAAAGLTLIEPVLSGDRLCGLLLLGERGGGDVLGRLDVKLLEILSTAIVAALQNAETFERTQRSFLETTAELIAGIEDRYDYLRGHSRRVADMAVAVGAELGMSEGALESLRFGALLHDLGQLDQYRDLLDRSVLLSPSDRHLHRRHVAERVAHLLGPGGKGAVGEIVLHAQEYWDGSGLPDGLRGTEIPLGARIVALVNAYDALTHDRPHRQAYDAESAMQILRDRAGKQFDQELVAALSGRLERIPAAATI